MEIVKNSSWWKLFKKTARYGIFITDDNVHDMESIKVVYEDEKTEKIGRIKESDRIASFSLDNFNLEEKIKIFNNFLKTFNLKIEKKLLKDFFIENDYLIISKVSFLIFKNEWTNFI